MIKGEREARLWTIVPQSHCCSNLLLVIRIIRIMRSRSRRVLMMMTMVIEVMMMTMSMTRKDEDDDNFMVELVKFTEFAI